MNLKQGLCGALIALSAAWASAATPPTPPPLGEEGRIAFANRRDGIFNWQADGEKGIWVQAPNRQWYYGKFLGPCIDLPWAYTVAFNTEPNGDFDKFSFIEVRREERLGMRQRCPLTSLVTSTAPPTSKQRKAAASAAAAAATTSAP